MRTVEPLRGKRSRATDRDSWLRRFGHPSVTPALLVLVLSAPRLALGYFWDDYSFLTFHGTGDPRVYLLPDYDYAFYRPITQSLYFLGLGLIDASSGVAGHWINLLALAGATGLFATLVARLAGTRAGLTTGLALASVGCMPGLVAWISCCQDLFAILFVVLALWLRHAGRNVSAAACAAAALLSKEAAVAVVPVLVLWDVIAGRPHRIRRDVTIYGAMLVVWSAVHPGIRTLVARGFQSGATGYVGFEDPFRGARFLGRYLLTVFNVPITGLSTPWPEGWFAPGVAAALLVLTLGLLAARRKPAPSPPRRLFVLALALLLLPLLLPSTMIRLWAPYYASLGALGAALVIGLLLARAPVAVSALALGAFLVAGIWSRGLVSTAEPIWSEAAFLEASRAARRVEGNFKRLHPEMPERTNALVLVTSTGFRGISSTLLENQALRVWYGNPEISTMRPERRREPAPVELLFRVTSGLDVVEIDPWRFQVRWTGTGTPDPGELNRSIRAYARGLAASGQSGEAVEMLRKLADVEQGEDRAYDQRLSASILLAEGRRDQAERIMAGAPSFPYELRLEIMRKILSEPSTNASLDSSAFAAFELSASDTAVVRYLMRRFFEDGLEVQADEWAGRLQMLEPGERESAEILEKTREKRRLERQGS